MSNATVPRIDAHQHFWRYDAVEYGWITPEFEALRRDFLPADLVPHLAAAGVDGTIAVQARESLDETEFLLGLDPERTVVRGVVGWLDLLADDLQYQLDAFADEPALVGHRHTVQDEPDDRFLDREPFRDGVRSAAARGLVYDVLIFPRQLPAALDFVRALSNVPMVLDHCAKPPLREGEGSPSMQAWAEGLRALGSCDNLTCKVSGLVTEADWNNWSEGEIDRCVDVALEAFGPARLMAGSDWPVCTLAAPYEGVNSISQRFAARLSADESAAFLGGTAARVYGLA